MSNFIPLNKINGACPVCAKDDGSCRRSRDDENFILCQTHASARYKEKVNGYICVKASTGGHTASFKPYKNKFSQNWVTQQLQENHLRREKRKRIEAEQKKRALSVEERHQLYSEILDQLEIDKTTQVDLLRRGFIQEEIDASDFKSVKKWQKLNKSFPINLPGIGINGSSLVTPASGYLCPLKDFDGNITALQLRLHTLEDGNRYRWLSTPKTATLKIKTGKDKPFENPLAVFHPPGGKPKGIAIVEGTGCKPYFVAQRLNYLTIGAAGGQWLSSPHLFKKYIEQAIAYYGELPIIVIPDAGFALNPNVKRQLTELFDWLTVEYKQKPITVLDWNQIHKSQGDIDEIDDLDIVRRLGLLTFRDKKYKQVFEPAAKQNAFEKWATSRVKLTADIVQEEKWLTIPQGIEKECDILLIRKALGGGKTQALIDFLKTQDIVSLLVGYRNTLLYNTIDRANNNGLVSQHIKEVVEHIGGKRINFASDDSIKVWAGCADSFHKFNAIKSHNSDYYLIHDEICSVLNHLKGGGTLKGRQQLAIDWDVETIQDSAFSVMMDANLSDTEVDFIRSLFPHKRIKVLDSVYPSTPRQFTFLETALNKEFSRHPKYLTSQLLEKAKKFKKVLWISDSQRSCEVADRILTKSGHNHFRLDGKTSHDDLAKQFQSNPKSFIITHHLDSLSLSPSGESGLSIDLYDYFDAVCFDIKGTVSVNTLTQLSSRLRDTSVPILVACPEFINITANTCPYPIKKVEQVMKERLEALKQTALSADEELLDSDFVKNMFNEMATKFSTDLWFVESLKDAKRLKYEHSNLKLCFKTALAQAGHKIIDLVETASEVEFEQQVQVKQEVKQEEAEKIFKSEDIDWEQAQQLAKKDVNYDDKCKIRKARLKHSLPSIEKTNIWSSDLVLALELEEPTFVSKRWRLKQLERPELFSAVFKVEKKYGFEHGFAAAEVWKASSTKLQALKSLGFYQILQAKEFSVQDKYVQDIVDKYYDEDEWFNLLGIPRAKRTLNQDGYPTNKMYVKKMADRFAAFFGLQLVVTRRTNITRYYAFEIPLSVQPFIDDVDNCLAKRADSVLLTVKEVSLKEQIDKARQAKEKEREWDKEHQVELNKRMLEAASQAKPVKPTSFVTPSSIYINQKQEVSQFSTYLDNDQYWNTQEAIVGVCYMLEVCETYEQLQDIRQTTPPQVLKLASRSLPDYKRQQIRNWVLKI